MLQKYIVAEINHNKKNYRFHDTILEYDMNISSLIMSDDYVKKDIDDHICHLYSLFHSMVNARIYSSMSSVIRAVKNGALEANLVIIYTSDLEKLSITDGWYTMKDSKSLKQMLNYMTSVQYSYSFKTKVINRYELYGDPILGDDIHRPISDLINDLDIIDISKLDSDKVINTYGLSRELGEFYNNGKIIVNDTRIIPWEIHINPPILKTDKLYFQLYNWSRLTSRLYSNSTKCARISMISSEYIHCSDCSKEEWILTSNEKETLCNALTNNVWEKLKDEYIKSLMFADNDIINKIKNLSMPDYSKLPCK